MFSFVMKMEKLSFPEALQLLAQKAGIDYNPERREPGKREALLELYRKVAGSFHHILIKSEEGRQAGSYLAQRGITPETLEKYSVGYAPKDREWLLQFLLDKGFSRTFLAESGLFSIKGSALKAFFWGRIMFPISNARGEAIAFGGRNFLDRDTRPKYINSAESSIFRKGENLFGLSQALSGIKKNDRFILVEGYMDVLAMQQMGHVESIAPLGTSLTEPQLRLLKRYTPNGTLLFDGDEAGSKAVRRSLLMMERQGISASVVPLADGMDPADFVKTHQEGRLAEYLDNPEEGFKYMLDFARMRHDVSSPVGKESLVDELVPYLDSIPSEVRRDGYLSAVAGVLNVPVESVRKDYGKRAFREKVRTKVGQKPSFSADLYLMIAVALNLDYYTVVRKNLSHDDLNDDRAKQIFVSLEECFRKENTDLHCLLEALEEETLKTMILEKMASDEFSSNQEKIINDSIFKIKNRNLEKKRDMISSLLRQAERDEPWRLKALLEEKMLIDDEIEGLKVIKDVRNTE